MGLKFAFFRSFKGADTLLIWGNDDFDKLRDLFEHLSDGPIKSIDFKDTGYLKPVGPCSVIVSRTGMESGSLIITTHNSEAKIACCLTQAELRRFSEKIDYLASDETIVAHQYLDTESVQPFQIMVARGEYPTGLNPDD
jgi:hypothetical protein